MTDQHAAPESTTLTKRVSQLFAPLPREDGQPYAPKRRSFLDAILRKPEAPADDDSATEADKKCKLGTKRWTIAHGMQSSRDLGEALLPAQSTKVSAEGFFSPKVPDALAESTQSEPDMVPDTAKPLPSDGKGGVATRHVPVPRIPDPMPKQLEFMFRKYSNDEVAFCWRVYLVVFLFQVLWCWLYGFAVGHPEFISFRTASWIYGVVQAYICIQNIYMLHDVLHVAPFPPQPWMAYITHPFSDLLNCGWQDIMLEHKRHHVATADVLHHGEFGWDPSEVQYFFQEYSKWTAPLCYFVQLLGFYDTGMLFMASWYWHFPDENAIEEVLRPRNSEDRKKTMQRRIQCALIQLTQWYVLIKVATVLAGGWSENALPIFLVVLAANRVGWGTAWYFFANINHSETWNEMLADGLDRKWPICDAVLTCLLGGRARVNEMKFHDLHHAFPNRIGAMSMRGRFYDWQKVHDGALEIIANGIFEEPELPQQSIESKPAQKKSSKTLNDLQKKRVSNRPDLLAKAARQAIQVV
jgi:hypothetical protein